MNYRTKTYLVRWEIPIEANSAKEAAIEALKIHRDPKSIATAFEVMQLGVMSRFEPIDVNPECLVKTTK